MPSYILYTEDRDAAMFSRHNEMSIFDGRNFFFCLFVTLFTKKLPKISNSQDHSQMVFNNVTIWIVGAINASSH